MDENERLTRSNSNEILELFCFLLESIFPLYALKFFFFSFLSSAPLLLLFPANQFPFMLKSRLLAKNKIPEKSSYCIATFTFLPTIQCLSIEVSNFNFNKKSSKFQVIFWTNSICLKTVQFLVLKISSPHSSSQRLKSTVEKKREREYEKL